MTNQETELTVRNGSALSTRESELELVKQRFLSEIATMESSRKTYGYGLSKYFRWVSETGRSLSAAGVADIIRFKEDLEREGRSCLTIRSYMTAVRLFYRWIETNGYGKNIAGGVKVRSDKNTFVKMHLELDECRDLLQTTIEDTDRNALRNYCIVNLILHTGLRTVEVCRLDIADIETRRGRRVMKVWGKGRHDKDKVVVLTDEAYRPIEEYLRLKRPDAQPRDPLFVTNGDGYPHKNRRMSPRSIQMICKKNLNAIGLTGHGYSAHSLRHTTAVQILKNGGDIRDAQRVLRHSSPVTTEIYLQSIEDDERIDKAAEPLLDGLFSLSQEEFNQNAK